MSDDTPQPHRVRIEPAGWTFLAAPGQTLREAAAAAGLVLPTACRNGTCRACLARVLQGTVGYRIEWPGLSAEEKTAGWTLPCVALAHTDLVIEQAGTRQAPVSS